jgi:phage terminase large subunit-like protein
VTVGGQPQYTLAQIKAEKIRQLQEEGLRFYEPYPRQKEFHAMKAREKRGFLSGNRGGKSYAGVMEDILVTGKVHPWRPNKLGITVQARVCCVSFGAIFDILIPLFKAAIPRKRCQLDWNTYEGKPATFPGLKGGSWDSAFDKERLTLYLGDDEGIIDFKSYTQDREVYQGVTRDFTHFDEEPPLPIYEESLARHASSKYGVDMAFTLTMINYSQWLYEALFHGAINTPDKVGYVMADSRENPYVNEAAIESMAESITDEAIREARLTGRPTVLSGRVHKDYGDHNVIDYFAPPRGWHQSVIIDPHPEKASGVIFVAEDEWGKLYVWQELFPKGDVEHQCKQIKNAIGNYDIDLWLMDPSARQKATTRGKPERLIDEFRVYLPYIIEANNNRAVGIDRVNRMVKDSAQGPKLFVMKSCPITDFQMRNLMWKPPLKTGEVRDKPEVYKRDDETPDCVRYRVMYGRASRGEHEFVGWETRGYAS